jgi:hypothetical protein
MQFAGHKSLPLFIKHYYSHGTKAGASAKGPLPGKFKHLSGIFYVLLKKQRHDKKVHYFRSIRKSEDLTEAH